MREWSWRRHCARKDGEEFFQNLDTVHKRLQDKGLTVDRFGLTIVEYVGQTINNEGINFTREKLRKVISFAKPIRSWAIKIFHRNGELFRIPYPQQTTYMVTPLTKLLEKYSAKHILQWNDEVDAAFTEIGKAVIECPILLILDIKAGRHL